MGKGNEATNQLPKPLNEFIPTSSKTNHVSTVFFDTEPNDTADCVSQGDLLSHDTNISKVEPTNIEPFSSDNNVDVVTSAATRRCKDPQI